SISWKVSKAPGGSLRFDKERRQKKRNRRGEGEEEGEKEKIIIIITTIIINIIIIITIITITIIINSNKDFYFILKKSSKQGQMFGMRTIRVGPEGGDRVGTAWSAGLMKNRAHSRAVTIDFSFQAACKLPQESMSEDSAHQSSLSRAIWIQSMCLQSVFGLSCSPLLFKSTANLRGDPKWVDRQINYRRAQGKEEEEEYVFHLKYDVGEVGNAILSAEKPHMGHPRGQPEQRTEPYTQAHPSPITSVTANTVFSNSPESIVSVSNFLNLSVILSIHYWCETQ
ncbi:hypothetical protein STEG23_010054, partial [Scotinomys teguina]